MGGVLVALAVLVAGVPALAWLTQDSLIFLPRFATQAAPMPVRAQPLEIAAADGVRLRGWLLPPRVPRGEVPAPLVIYFGGNAENVSWTLAAADWPADWALAAFNYRGYGDSEGRPSERALVADALAIHDALAVRADVDAAWIVGVGRSLGSAVAVALARQRGLAGVLLVSPFDSFVALGRHHYPWLPVGMLLRHRFDCLETARATRTPAHVIVAGADTIVPPQRSRALFDAWAGPKSWQVVEGADHNTLGAPGAYWEGVRGFLARLTSTARASPSRGPAE